MRRYVQQPTSKNLSTLQTFRYIFLLSPNHIPPGAAVAVTTHELWVGLPANHYLVTLLFLPPDPSPRGTYPPTRLTDRFGITIYSHADMQ